MSIITPHCIFCDEAGFTGNNLLNDDQRYFAYASHDLSSEEARDLLNEARSQYKVQMPELKSRLLMRTSQGRGMLDFVTQRLDGRYIATLYDKRLALCCKLFEYIYEPVLQRNNKLFYDNNLHRFVAMFLYMHMLAAPITMDGIAKEFEAFLRSLDPSDAPTLLGSELKSETADPLDMIRRFARGYNVVIAQETRSLRETGDQGRWVLDLTISAVFSHLVEWGKRHPLIEVICDDSKPLLALSNNFDGMVNRPEAVEGNIMGSFRRMTWNMSKPVSLASSANSPGLQLADLLAGCAAAAPRYSEHQILQTVSARIYMHVHEESIMPDMEPIDLACDEAAINFFILEGLAQRADSGEDPLWLMDEMYEIARNTLPEFRRGKFT
jgi:hypothetical protein